MPKPPRLESYTTLVICKVGLCLCCVCLQRIGETLWRWGPGSDPTYSVLTARTDLLFIGRQAFRLRKAYRAVPQCILH
ncbi:hypothetical protein F4810DRAFT_670495 [Camillea tinctor]|nr:hypothetical protein F4810DRAFT_670495 [Camillea tinctor]